MATVYTRASKGSALTWAEGDANINNLNNDKIEAVADDATPQLGGDLDVQANKITTSTVNGDILLEANGTGIIQLKNDTVIGDGVNQAFLTSFGANDLTLVTDSGTNSGTINITAGANGDITLSPNGTGAVIIDGNEFPQAIGDSGMVLTADGSGLVEWKLPGPVASEVYNADSVQINKGQPVYVFGSTGSLISVKLAVNTGDATSAQTLGIANENIAAGSTGVVLSQGVIKGLDTSLYTAGQALYLDATAGSITTTKPSAPNHLVYLGFVETVNAVSGRIYVRVQNGYELQELHNVQITTTPTDGDVLTYDSALSLWRAQAPTGGGLSNLVEDLTPQLGGDLDVNGFDIISTGTASINLTSQDVINLQVMNNANRGIVISEVDAGDPGSPFFVTQIGTLGATETLAINPNGNLACVATDVYFEGGNVNFASSPGSNGNMIFTTDGTGIVALTSNNIRTGTTGGNVTITTNGTGDLTLNTNAGTNSGVIKIFDGLDSNITITPSGNGQTVVKNIEYNENIFSLGTTSGNITPNVSNGNVQTITLNGNLTLNAFASPVAGQSLTLIINTNGTGRTLTSTMLFAGGSKTLSTTSTVDIISIFYTGTTYYASLSKGFA